MQLMLHEIQKHSQRPNWHVFFIENSQTKRGYSKFTVILSAKVDTLQPCHPNV